MIKKFSKTTKLCHSKLLFAKKKPLLHEEQRKKNLDFESNYCLIQAHPFTDWDST